MIFVMIKNVNKPEATPKIYLSSKEVLQAGQDLAIEIINRQLFPDLVVVLWRGGALLGTALQETLALFSETHKNQKLNCQHHCLQTSSYTGIESPGEVKVIGTELLLERAIGCNRILIVDDIWDSGNTIMKVRSLLQAPGRDILTCVGWFHRQHNQHAYDPDYFYKETSQWVVFPHELCGLSREEIIDNKKELSEKLLEQITLRS
jgi:hypoxanthine phosphoribosyltransferase